MYNCAGQIPRVLAQFSPETAAHFARVLVVDNRSSDASAAVAGAAIDRLRGVEALLVQNDQNVGLGGSHKVGFAHALAHDFDEVVILHGDDQGSIADLVPHLGAGRDVTLGGRFMPGSRLIGYSRLRRAGNRVFNALFSTIAGRPIHDLGAGLNLYRTAILRDPFYARFPDDLTFNVCMLMAHLQLGHTFDFVPISWREEDAVSNVRLASQTQRQLGMLLGFARDPAGFLQRELRARSTATYASRALAANFAYTDPR